MSNSFADQLDFAITALLAGHRPAAAADELNELLAIADDLRDLPSPAFQARLKADLLDAAWLARVDHLERRAALAPATPLFPENQRESAMTTNAEFLPTLFSASTYPVRRTNFAASFALHAVAIAALLLSTLWISQHPQQLKQSVISIIGATDISPYVAPPSEDKLHGGGGGGNRDQIEASKGAPPKFADEQFTPPVRVIHNQNPALPMNPTVIGPPQVKLAQNMPLLGDPYSHNVNGPESNGIGSGGGIGSGSGGGVGSGRGPGVGPGWGGGFGGGAYHVGGGVSAPRLIEKTEPEYSEEGRKTKTQGTVVVECVVGPDGRVHSTRVVKSLGMGLDEKALEALRYWKFEPSRKDGQPVSVLVNVEVNFRLY
jgi:protein TonB